MRLDTTQRSKWAQLRIGACALLLPPLTLGAALLSMLAPPDDGAARPSGQAAGAQAVRTGLLRNTMQPGADGADPQPVARTIQPIAVADKPAHPESRDSVPAVGARQESVSRSAEDMGQVLVPVRVRVTAAPSSKLNPSPPATADHAPPGSPGAGPSQSAPMEASTALLPRALNASAQASPQIQSPRMLPAQMLAAQAPLVDLPAAEGPPAAVAAKPAHPSESAHRSHTFAFRRHTHPRRQHEFSLQDWLQQHFGTRPNNTRG